MDGPGGGHPAGRDHDPDDHRHGRHGHGGHDGLEHGVRDRVDLVRPVQDADEPGHLRGPAGPDLDGGAQAPDARRAWGRFDRDLQHRGHEHGPGHHHRHHGVGYGVPGDHGSD